MSIDTTDKAMTRVGRNVFTLKKLHSTLHGTPYILQDIHLYLKKRIEVPLPLDCPRTEKF